MIGLRLRGWVARAQAMAQQALVELRLKGEAEARAAQTQTSLLCATPFGASCMQPCCQYVYLYYGTRLGGSRAGATIFPGLDLRLRKKNIHQNRRKRFEGS